jgi:hypothetical protein
VKTVSIISEMTVEKIINMEKMTAVGKHCVRSMGKGGGEQKNENYTFSTWAYINSIHTV